MKNLDIENFKNDFQSLLEKYSSILPVGIVYYILKFEMRQLENIYIGAINSQMIEEQKEKNSTISQDEAN